MSLKRALYLDDLRIPTKQIPGYHPWEVVTNFDEFTKHIEDNGCPDYISFDHDLHQEHYAPEHLWNTEGYTEFAKGFVEKTGLDCAKWLCDFCEKKGIDVPLCSIHSDNPVGADNIKNYINNYKRFYKQSPDCFITKHAHTLPEGFSWKDVLPKV